MFGTGNLIFCEWVGEVSPWLQPRPAFVIARSETTKQFHSRFFAGASATPSIVESLSNHSGNAP